MKCVNLSDIEWNYRILSSNPNITYITACIPNCFIAKIKMKYYT